MCKASECVITAVYQPDSETYSLWVTEAVEEGQFEIVAFSDGSDLDLGRAFEELRDAIIWRSQFGMTRDDLNRKSPAGHPRPGSRRSQERRQKSTE